MAEKLSEGTRLKALARLIGSQSKAAENALNEALDAAIQTLENESDFERLKSALETLDVLCPRFPRKTINSISAFLGNIEQRQLAHAEDYQAIAAASDFFSDLYGPVALMTQALEVVSKLRYLRTRKVLEVLLRMSSHAVSRVREMALESLGKLAIYDLIVFYGTKERPGIGSKPQEEVIDFVERLDGDQVVTHWEAVLKLVEKLLAERIQGTEWSYNQVVWSEAAIPASEQVAKIRDRAIAWLMRTFESAGTVGQRRRILDMLHSAALAPRGGGDAAKDMVAADTIGILRFFKGLVSSVELQLVETIESDAYWIHFHSPSDAVRAAALEVKEAVDAHNEYQIFKFLIGFEGVFGGWGREDRQGEDFTGKDRLRKERAKAFAASIDAKSQDEWLERIRVYSAVESNDLATFPVFVYFLEQIAAAHSDLAGRLAQDRSLLPERFLVPLLTGLAAAGRVDTAHGLINKWLNDGVHLLQCGFALEYADIFDLSLAKRMLARASDLGDEQAIIVLMGALVATAPEQRETDFERLFGECVSTLDRLKSAGWVFHLWFRPKLKSFLTNFDESDVETLLRNLIRLEEIDYHAEEILSILAVRHPMAVLDHFIGRIKRGAEAESEKYEAIPYDFQKVHEELAKYPKECLDRVSQLFTGDYTKFHYGGAKLLKGIFADFPHPFEQELLALVSSGDSRMIEIVLAVLRNFDADKVDVRRICKAIVNQLSEDDPMLGEVEAVLDSTGVVTGEYGYAEALEQKRRDLQDWFESSDSKVKKFAQAYSDSLEKRAESERARATEGIALRKARYGQL